MQHRFRNTKLLSHSWSSDIFLFNNNFSQKTYLIEFSCGENHKNLSSHTSHHHARLPWIGFGGFLFFLIHSSLADDSVGGDFHQKSINLWLCWSRHLHTTIWTNLLWTLNITVKHHNPKRANDLNNNGNSEKIFSSYIFELSNCGGMR